MRFIGKKKLSRRMFLGGAAVTVSLPFLDAMVPAGLRGGVAKAAGEFPCRIGFVHVPNGMIRTRMKPVDTGYGYTLPSMLQPLADIQGDFSVISGLSNRPGQGRYTYPDGTMSDDGPGDHARDTATFLTATRIKKTDGTDIQNGISVDQVAANHLRSVTPEIPSLELGTRAGSYGGDSGYAPIYKANISWSGPTTPVPKETDPQAVFDRLFAGVDPTETTAERERRQRLEQSVLDTVLDDVNALRADLGTSDQQKLDEYLSGVRHLEVRIQENGFGRVCDPGTRPSSPANFQAHVDVMFDLIAMSFACDRTRVFSLMLDKGGSYDFLQVDGSPIIANHHQISHLDNGNGDVRQIEAINQWQLEAFGNLVRKLKAFTEDDGSTLLDHSLIMFGGGLDGTGHANGDGSLTPQASGPVHRHNNLPIFLAGSGGGAASPGQHLDVGEEPIADLYLAMLHSVGAMESSFGIEGSRPLSGI